MSRYQTLKESHNIQPSRLKTQLPVFRFVDLSKKLSSEIYPTRSGHFVHVRTFIGLGPLEEHEQYYNSDVVAPFLFGSTRTDKTEYSTQVLSVKKCRKLIADNSKCSPITSVVLLTDFKPSLLQVGQKSQESPMAKKSTHSKISWDEALNFAPNVGPSGHPLWK